MREGTEKLKPITQEEIKPIDYKEINNKIGLNNIKVHQAPVLTISAWCHNHIKALHKEYPHTEWTAICKIVNHGEGQFEMVDMIHPQQKGVGSEVETTDEGMEWAIDHLLERGEDLGEWNCVLHSHHIMGCFWSGTDDKARLSMNDGRMLMWAVVTAYKGEEINYKGCLNFYKPYPIEIDCDIEYYTEDLYGQREEWGEFVKNRTQEIYNEMVLTDEKLKSYKCEYDYDNLLKYLGIDITDELRVNSDVIAQKMPCPEYEERLKEIMEEAKEKVQEETGAPIDNELLAWSEWSNSLLEQLDEARKLPVKEVTPTYNNYSYNNWNDYDFYGYPKVENKTVEDKKETKTKSKYDEEYENYYQFNAIEYPTKNKLVETWGFDENMKFRVNDDNLWEVYNTTFHQWLYVGDEYEDMYAYPDDYL